MARPKGIPNGVPEAERFWRQVRRTEGCWEYTGYIDKDGYGKVMVMRDGRKVCMRAHRYAWLLTHGALASDVELMHRCDNRRCVREDHLQEGTHQENMHDMTIKGRRAVGFKLPHTKLSQQQRQEIIQLRAEKVTLQAIADRYGVTFQHVSAIARGLR